MHIKNLLNVDLNLEISYISSNSKDIKENTLFFLLKNTEHDLEYALEALNSGAVAIVTEELIDGVRNQILVKDIHQVLQNSLNRFYDFPQNKIKLVGITGTDGKTTCATISQYLLSSKYKVANIGTNGINYFGYYYKTNNTTPISYLLFRELDKMVKSNVEIAVMEASSEGILNRRIDDVIFDVGIFTNLSHEHLNSHLTMENYFMEKVKLFKNISSDGLMIVNIDDEYGKKLLTLVSLPFLTYGINEEADFRALNVRIEEDYTTFDLKLRRKIYRDISINLFGLYNVYNVLPAIILALYFNVSFELIRTKLNNLPIVKGRLNFVTKFPYMVIVDFAHTPNALYQLLTNVRLITKKKLVIVLGAAGNKDATKRPLMGKVATKHSDFVIFTSEDPKDEPLENIIHDLTSEIETTNYCIIFDRKDAIKYAIDNLEVGDTLLITGKGMEEFEQKKEGLVPHSDYLEAQKCLKSREPLE